jgi:L-ascorbate metabolism protein UlaG (beta-lactamase superfamily)
MIKSIIFFGIILFGIITVYAAEKFEMDTIPTSAGELKITFIGHGTLMLNFNNLTIHVDPVGSYDDYSTLPKADLILVTHEHGDHLDAQAIETISTEKTRIILNEKGFAKLNKGQVMKNGDMKTIAEIKIEAVPAYNIKHERRPGMPFHPKGDGNGYVLTFGDKKVYIAGDTENIPEMARLKDIHCAFLPMNLPYTMTPEMVADAAKTIKPKILYPYHFGDTDTNELVKLLKNEKQIEVRIRNMK